MRRQKDPMIQQQAMAVMKKPPSPKIALTVLQPDGQPAANATVKQHVSPGRVRGQKVPVQSTSAEGKAEFVHDDRWETTRYYITHKTGSTVFGLADHLPSLNISHVPSALRDFLSATGIPPALERRSTRPSNRHRDVDDVQPLKTIEIKLPNLAQP